MFYMISLDRTEKYHCEMYYIYIHTGHKKVFVPKLKLNNVDMYDILLEMHRYISK